MTFDDGFKLCSNAIPQMASQRSRAENTNAHLLEFTAVCNWTVPPAAVHRTEPLSNPQRLEWVLRLNR